MDNKTKEILKKLEPIRDKLLSEYYSDEEYRELLMAMGVTAWEWEQLNAGFDDFIARAEGYIKHGLADEAIEELKAAQIIDPNDLEMHRCFSQAYLQLWKAKGIQKYATLAEKHAKNCLQINSEYVLAVKILAQLKETAANEGFRTSNAPLFQQKGSNSKKENSTPKPQKKNSGINLGTIVSTAGMLLILIYMFYPSPKSSQEDSYSSEKEVQSSYSSSETPKKVEPQKVKKNLLTLPFEFDKRGHENVEFDIKESSFKGKADAYSYYSSLFKMTGFVQIKDAEAERIELLYDLYQGDKIVHTDKGYVSIPKGMQAGDKLPFLIIHGEKEKEWKVSKVNLRISKFKEKAAKASYPESLEVDLIWRVKQTEKINLHLEERHSEIKYNEFSKDMLHSFTFLIENKGTADLQEIKCKFNWYDTNDELISEDIVNLWGTINPTLEAGMKVLSPNKVLRLDVGQKKIKVARYSVELLDIKY